MKNVTKLLALLLALAMLAGLCAGCGGEQPGTNTPGNETPGASENPGGEQPGNENPGNADSDSPYGGHLNVAIKSRPTSLDPVKASSSWVQYWAACVYEPMLNRDMNNNIVPGVCDFELSEDQTDLKLWPREGYTFSGDYGAVDVYDIEASFNRGLKMHTNIKKYVAPYVKSVTVENDGQKDVLHVVFSQYNEMNMYYLACGIPYWSVQPKEVCEKYASTNIIDQIPDAVGTGPYEVIELVDSIQVTLQRRADYVPVDNSMYSGTAGTKYAYMDTITFWYNGDDSSCAMGLMNGDYDMTEAVPVDYKSLTEGIGLTVSVLPSNQRTWIFFNTMGTANLCAKYPALRKAVMAAIDYDEFLSVVTDQSHTFDKEVIIDEKYATDAFTSQDYYGSANQEAVDKYLAEARAQGYNNEPLQLYFKAGRNDISSLLRDYMEDAGINYEMNVLENYAASQYIGDPSNNWDFTFSWSVSAWTPSMLSDTIMVANYGSTEKDAILEKMRAMEPGCEEYMQLWQQLAQLTADECYVGYMSAIDWWWWHPETLNINDEGLMRYVWNCYWDDPSNHPRK